MFLATTIAVTLASSTGLGINGLYGVWETEAIWKAQMVNLKLVLKLLNFKIWGSLF